VLEKTLTVVDGAGDRLRVTFVKTADRWRHAIERVRGQSVETIFSSVEGDPNAAWPVSPPFQELSEETLPNGRTVFFLVGRAGTSHWSASIEAAVDPPGLIFDIACRHGETPVQLGSTYRALSEGAPIEALDDLANVTAQENERRIVPQQVATRLPGTTRWKYRVR
jgi:hypothetical protein